MAALANGELMTKKPKKFFGRHEADRRALKLYAALRKIEKMPLVGLDVRDGAEPIVIWDANDTQRYSTCSISLILKLDIDKAIEAGGSFKDLLWTRKPAPRPSIPYAEVERASHAFITGEEEEDPPE